MSDHLQAVLLTFAIAWVLASIFVHFAAKIVVGRSGFGTALLAVLLGSLLAGVVQILATGEISRTWVVILALAAYALGLAAVYRTAWLKGVLLGFVAWLLWIFTYYLVTEVILD